MLMPCEYLTLEENPTDKANENNRKSKHLIKKDIGTEEADPSNDSDESDDEIPTFEPCTMQESDVDVSGTAPSTQPVENLDAETVRDELELEDHLSESEVQSSIAEPPSINDSTDETLRERPTRMRNPPTRLVYNQLGLSADPTGKTLFIAKNSAFTKPGQLEVLQTQGMPALKVVGFMVSSYFDETHETIRIAMKESIIIIFLPPHKGHALQPLDVAVVKPLKELWKRFF
eukprot:gene4303-4872_t